MKTRRNIALNTIILVMFSAISFAQVNHVFNPSFELIYSCPNNAGQIDSTIGWCTPINGGGSTPDLFTKCCTQSSICGVPLNSFNSSFQYPHSGNSYAGINVVLSFYTNNWREYIQSKLKKGLLVNHTYCVKFYASLSDQNLAYIKTLGAYLDNGSVSAPAPHGLALVTPQVYNTAQFLSDTINWMRIEGSFVATGNEDYITIGNFFTDSASGIGFFGTPTNWGSYYYIDDVSVIDVNLPAYAGKDTLIHPGDSIYIGRQSEIGLDEDCIWFVNGLPIDTVAGMWVKPDSNTTYILQQTICGNVSYDTVNITVGYAGINEFTSLSDNFKVYPNPLTDITSIETTNNKLIKTIRIYNLLGQEVYYKEVGGKPKVQLYRNDLVAGIFVYRVQTENGNMFTGKLVVQ